MFFVAFCVCIKLPEIVLSLSRGLSLPAAVFPSLSPTPLFSPGGLRYTRRSRPASSPLSASPVDHTQADKLKSLSTAPQPTTYYRPRKYWECQLINR